MGKIHSRIFGLDLLRAIAVLLVLLAHTITFIGNTNIINNTSFFSGVLGVEFFFVLSGFLIGGILIKMHNQHLITKFYSINIFWIRRWFRTLPNYYLILIVSSVLFYLTTKEFIFETGYGLSFFFFLQNFTSEFTSSFFGVSWSLAVEEWFYLLFPVFLFLSQYIFSNKKKSFLLVIVGFIVIPLVIKIILSLSTNIAWDAGYRKIALLRLDAVGFGVLMAYLNYYKKTFLERKRNILFFLGLLLFVLLNFLLYNMQILNYDFANQKQIDQSSFFMNTLFFTFISFSISLLIPLLLSVKNKNNLIYKVINFISLISYSIYLSHPLYIFLCTYINSKLNLNNNMVLLVMTIWITTIIGSYFQYRFFEVKFTALRDKFGVEKDKITV